jgi:hypothetical protein
MNKIRGIDLRISLTSKGLGRWIRYHFVYVSLFNNFVNTTAFGVMSRAIFTKAIVFSAAGLPLNIGSDRRIVR